VSSKPATSYIPGLDGVRAIAFLLVFLAHGSTGNITVPATLGVTIFFFLSGYLITTLLRKEYARTGTIAFRDFYIRRALRILVPLYIVYALAEVLGRVFLHQGGTLAGFLSSVFYYFNYGYALGVRGYDLHIYSPIGMSVIWSLCIEEHFYFLFPVCFLWIQRARLSPRARMGWIVGFCSLELLWRAYMVLSHFRGFEEWTYYATDARLDSILWGAFLAMFFNPVLGDRTLLPKRRPALAFGLSVAALFASLQIHSLLYRDAFRYTLQALLMLVIFSFIVSGTNHWSVRWLEWPVVRYLGWTSYVLYLCHFVVMSLVSEKTHWPWPVKLVVELAISVAFASLMRYTVELPLQRLRGRFRRVPERDTTAADGHGLIS